MAAGAVATTAAEKHPFTHPGNARTRVKGLRMDWCVSVAAPGEGAGPVGGWLFLVSIPVVLGSAKCAGCPEGRE